MIVYSATCGKFTEDVFSNVIEDKILAAFERRLSQSTSRSEIESSAEASAGCRHAP